MIMKSVFWWRKPEYPEETTSLRQVTLGLGLHSERFSPIFSKFPDFSLCTGNSFSQNSLFSLIFPCSGHPGFMYWSAQACVHRGVNGEDTKPINIGPVLFRIQIKAQKSKMVQQDMVSYKIISMFRQYTGADPGGAKGALPPPPPHKKLLPQIVRRGSRGAKRALPPPPPRGEEGLAPPLTKSWIRLWYKGGRYP